MQCRSVSPDRSALRVLHAVIPLQVPVSVCFLSCILLPQRALREAEESEQLEGVTDFEKETGDSSGTLVHSYPKPAKPCLCAIHAQCKRETCFLCLFVTGTAKDPTEGCPFSAFMSWLRR